jgi:hypothetical protein
MRITQTTVEGIEVGHLRRPVSETQISDLIDSITAWACSKLW